MVVGPILCQFRCGRTTLPRRHSAAPARICGCLQDSHAVVVRCAFLLFLRSVSRPLAATTVNWALVGQAGLPVPASHGWPPPEFVFFGSFLGGLTLGLVSLISNNFLAADPQIRRKAHVMLWGTVVSVTPIVLALAATVIGGLGDVPETAWDVCILLLSFVWPLSFAYAVVKHRVLEIPVLLKLSARYVLVQRGYFVLLFTVAAIAIVLFTHTISRFFPEGINIGMALSAVFGIVLVWVSAPMVKRGTERIDRAFFRSAYDARVILQNLVEKTRTVTDRHELARLLQLQIEGALHPKSLACYLEDGAGNLVAETAGAPPGAGTIPGAWPRPRLPVRFGARFLHRELDTIPATLPLLSDLARRGRAWDVPPAVSDEAGYVGPLAPECLVPVLARDGRLIGLVVLGQRLSEEPYSGEDKHLLDSVAARAGMTLENIDLAQKMAERMEAEHRIARDMEIAKQVQARLFSAEVAFPGHARICRPLCSGPRRRRRLLRFSEPRRRTHGYRTRRYRRKRHSQRSADGQLTGRRAQPVCHRVSRLAAISQIGEPGLLREHGRGRLRDSLLR